MDIFTKLAPTSEYSDTTLQLIIAAWVMSAAFERRHKVSLASGHVAEADYEKQSIYSLLYALYRSVGTVRSDTGAPYELTFNTWGYAWPEAWGSAPVPKDDPQRFGKNAYTGLYQFDRVRELVGARDGRVHVVEMGCGTGAGADHVCENVLPECTYEAVDMQEAAIRTCNRKFSPRHGGRLLGLRADCQALPMDDAVADIVAVCETHVTDQGGVVDEEDRRFFRSARRVLRPGGLMVWGNVIPDTTWQPCFDYLASIGMRLVEVRDVTNEAVTARLEDRARVQAFVDQAIDKFAGFRIPWLGRRRAREAELAMKNFYRDPGTNLYNDMFTFADTYKVVLLEKQA
ncbi:MAG: class I SAM-dependent methyltransferase [Sandaracinaceae bacterium]|nr:class I SAM-dependent methyltransferase [Sandaracinaceae bacterium]